MVWHWFSNAVESRLRVEVPRDVPLHHLTTQLDEDLVSVKTRRGAQVLTARWERGEEEWPEPIPASPIDHVVQPSVVFSTAPDWEAVAARYAELIAPAMDPARLPEAWKARVAEAPDDAAKVRTAFEIARDEIRYTGLELGEQSIVPRTPDEVAEAGFGDCKDKATLAASLLRQHGIDASVALIGSRYEPGPAEAPGIDLFDHAILHVAPDIWLDPTDTSQPFGDLSGHLRGRPALVVGPKGGRLKTAPWNGSADNALVEHRRVEIPLRGYSRVIERNTATGWMTYNVRPADRKQPEAEDYSEYGETAYTGEVVDVRVSSVELEPGPFELELEIADAQIGVGGVQSAEV